MDKNQLRDLYKKLRTNINPQQVEINSIKIAKIISNVSIWQYNYYHIFIPIVERNEVDTRYIINLLKEKNKYIIIPKTNFENFKMTNFLFDENLILETNKFNIPEPINGKQIETEKIEVIFLPLLAFDKIGNRVGYGKGLYDRFLQQCNPKVLKIGLSFFEAHNELINVNEHDIKLNFCVTPDKIYKF